MSEQKTLLPEIALKINKRFGRDKFPLSYIFLTWGEAEEMLQALETEMRKGERAKEALEDSDCCKCSFDIQYPVDGFSDPKWTVTQKCKRCLFLEDFNPTKKKEERHEA